MKLTQVHKDTSFNVFLDDNNEGFLLGREAKTIPQKYADINYKLEMRQVPHCEFNRVIDRTHIPELQNMKPAFVRVTEAGTLIIE